MTVYTPSTDHDRESMLRTIGAASVDELFTDIPEAMRCGPLNLPAGLSEAEGRELLQQLAQENHVFRTVCRGAGAYRHYIPAIVKRITSKDEFVTAYTPYQAELSQGILQSIFEYQSMICQLTGMDTANASVYDGGSAAAEAIAMTRERKRKRALVAATVNPQVLAVIRTYAFGSGDEIVVVPEKDGRLDQEALAALLGDDVSCLYLQQPNYYGLLEDAEGAFEKVHDAGAKAVLGCNPIALGLLKTPAEQGADIACGEGQPLGMPLSFGGPYLGFMACLDKLTRKLPGRIVGETSDHDGRRAFVLTLQAREQHIRREKASSNICSNEALCALTAAVYLSAMGPRGLQEVAQQSVSHAHYAAAAISAIPGFERVYDGEFFHEFVTACPVPTEQVLQALADRDILGGLPLDNNRLLWCFTELNSKKSIDEVTAILKEVAGHADSL